MKKRIRLGVSSMSNSRKYISQPEELQRSFETSSIGSSLSALSASDLDDMFESNLQLLENLKENQPTLNEKPKNFQSTLNIFISPNQSHKFTSVSENNRNEIIVQNNKELPRKKLNNSTSSYMYSSYETLYDDLMYKKDDYDKVKDWDCMTDSIFETSKGSIDDYLKFGSVISLESNRTLKSISSDNSSQISSIKSDDETFEINKSNQSLPIVSIMSNEVHMHTKLRYRPDRLLSRPKSYHPGESMGYYYSNKPLSNISSNPTDNKISRKEGSYAPSNIIISKSLKHSLVTPNNNSKSSILITNNLIQSRSNDKQTDFSISSRNLPIILNNNVVPLHHSSSSYLINNVPLNPPIPPRNRKELVSSKISENTQQETIQRNVTELSIQGSVKSCLNLNIDPHERNLKSNGLKFHLQSQNDGKSISYTMNQLKTNTRTKSIDQQKKL